MTTQNNENIDNNVNNEPEITLEDVLKEMQAIKQENNKLKSENEKMSNKNKQLLTEYKNTESVLKSFEKKFEDEEDRELLKKGDFETLLSKKESKFKSEFETVLSQKELEKRELENILQETQNELFKERFNLQVSNVLSSIPDLQQGADKLIKILIKENSKFENGKLKFYDENGNVKQKLKNDNKFAEYDLNDFVGDLRKTEQLLFRPSQGNETKSSRQSAQGKTVMSKQEFNKQIDDYIAKRDNKSAADLNKKRLNGDIIVE